MIFLDAESAPTFVHIKGTDNTAADGLSPLLMADDDDETKLAGELFVTINHPDRDGNTDFPLDMHQIMLSQEKDDDFQRLSQSSRFAASIGTEEIRIHGTLGDQLRTTIFDSNWSDDVDTLIQACAYVLRVTSPRSAMI